MAQPDLTEFHELSKPKKKPCPISAAFDQLGPKSSHGKQLTAALATDQGTISNTAVQKWLEARGVVDLRWQAIASHRRGVCGCSDD